MTSEEWAETGSAAEAATENDDDSTVSNGEADEDQVEEVPEIQSSPMREAIAKNLPEEVAALVDSNHELLETTVEYEFKEDGSNQTLHITPLAFATALNHLQVMEVLIAHEAKIDAEIPVIGGNMFHLAARYGYPASLEMLLPGIPNINEVDNENRTALHHASRYGPADSVEFLLSKGADLNLRDIQLSTPFHIAAMYGHKDILELLWSKGPKTQITDENTFGNQPLHLASLNDRYDAVEWLISIGAPINHSDAQGNNPLHLACQKGNLSIVKLLIEKNVNMHQRDEGSNSPILVACFNVHCDVVNFLRQNGALVSNVDVSENTCFHKVVYSAKPFSEEHKEVFEALIGTGLDIDQPNIHGYSPLFRACADRKVEHVKCLLELGANANSVATSSGLTPLMEACCEPCVEVVEVLLDKEADWNMTNKHGLNALALTSRFGQLENTKALLKRGVRVGVHDLKGHTPLCNAALHGHSDIALELLKAPDYLPEDLTIKKSFAESGEHVSEVENALDSAIDEGKCEDWDDLAAVMHWAVSTGCLELTKKCLAKKSDLLNWKRAGATWLHTAIMHGRYQLISDALDQVDVFAEASGGVTALHLAARFGNLDVAESLLQLIQSQSEQPDDGAWRKVEAIVKWNSQGESPLTLSIGERHKRLTEKFWEEIQSFGDSHKQFREANPERAEEILEILAIYEKPGHEEILKLLLKTWFPDTPHPEQENFTTLDWAVFREQAAVVWWLLSKGGYSSNKAIMSAQKLVKGEEKREDERKSEGEVKCIGDIIKELLSSPPPVLDRVANPNDDQPPRLPETPSPESEYLQKKGRIVDIYSDGRAINIPTTSINMWSMIYDRGPDSLMKQARNLDHRHLDKLKEKVAKLSNTASERPAASSASSDSPHGRSEPKPFQRRGGDLQLRWIHLPVNDLNLMRDLVTRLSHDSKRLEMDHNAIMRHFNRSWTELAAGGGNYYMKPQCVREQAGQSGHVQDKLLSSLTTGEPLAIYMPYLTLGDHRMGQNTRKENSQPQNAPGQDPSSHSEAADGVEESITSRNSRMITHEAMTLDQYYYPIILDTNERDGDQVLSRFLDRKQKAATNNPKKILMVDQLWIWIIDEKTIITAATETSDQTSKEKSASSLLQSALDNIIYGESKSRFERPTSVHSVMELILGIATGFFMKKYVSVQDPGHKNEHKGPLEIFRESIRDVADCETKLFSAFLKGLKKESQDRDSYMSNSEQKMGVRQMPQNPHHIISDETELLYITRDIRDELHMLRSLAEDQELVWKQAFSTTELRNCFQYYHPCTPTDVKKELDEMLLEVEMANDSINTLLDLRQKQASIKEAEFGRLQANDTARQSNSVFVFTVITIIFLPLSFLSSLFALDVTDFPHEGDDLKYTGRWLFPILFCVTAIVSIPAIILAWNVNAISGWLRPQRQQAPVASGLYDNGMEKGINAADLKTARSGTKRWERLTKLRKRQKKEPDSLA